MAITLAGIGAVTSVIGAIGGALGGRKSAKNAKKGGEAAASFIRAEGAEQERRTVRGQDQLRGGTMAAIGASGIHNTGSTNAYVKDMEAEFGREISWMRESTAKRAYAAKKGANVQASNLKSTATTGLLTGIGSVAMQIG